MNSGMDERTGTYTITVHAEDDGTYWVEVDELPGCFASGDTLEELWTNVAEAIGVYLSTEDLRVQVELEAPDPIVVRTREHLIPC